MDFAFLQGNNLGLGIIVSSIIVPLLVDYIKRRWDRINVEAQRTSEQIRSRQAVLLKQRSDILDAITTLLWSFWQEGFWLILDWEYGRQKTELAKEHIVSYDRLAKQTLRDLNTQKSKVKQYFERGDEYYAKLQNLWTTMAIIDGQIYLLTDIDAPKKKVNLNDWHKIRAQLSELPDQFNTVLTAMAMEIK